MTRPLVDHSIDQIEEACERAILSGDADQLRLIVDELQYRRTPRAVELKAAAEQRLRNAQPSAPTPSRPQPTGQGIADRGSPRSSGRKQAKKTPPPMHKPTVEQEHAIEAFRAGGSLKINAYAGTGKTSTLQMLSHATGRRGLYIAFNKSIVNDAKAKFADNVECSTIHSLAHRSVQKQFRANHHKMTGKVNAHRLAELLDLRKEWRVDADHVLGPVEQASLVLKTLTRYMQSAEPEILRSHVPRLGKLMTASRESMQLIEEVAVRGANHVWHRMTQPDDLVPLGFDGFLKLWALSNPKIAADFILLDEAQDTTPVVLGVLEKQSAQMIYVGDKYQQIYEWRGAVNAMDRVTADSTTFLTQSFRFGEEIAQAASKILTLLGEDKPLTGNPKVSSHIGRTEPRTILGRTNASTFRALTNAIECGQKPYLVGGKSEYFELLRGVKQLKDGKRSTVDEFFGFRNWREVVEFSKTPEGAQLQTFINLVETRGEENLIWALDQTVEEKDSDIVVSTAHKAKGREWSKVLLMDDFLKSAQHKDNRPTPEYEPSELQLFYVAMTRAQYELEIDPTLMPLIGLRAPPPLPREMDRDESIRQFWEQKSRERNDGTNWEPPRDWEPPRNVEIRKNSVTRPTANSRSTYKPSQAAKPPPATPAPTISTKTPKKKSIFDWLLGK